MLFEIFFDIILRGKGGKIIFKRSIEEKTFFGTVFVSVDETTKVPTETKLKEVRILEVEENKKNNEKDKTRSGIHHVLVTAKVTSDGKIVDTK